MDWGLRSRRSTYVRLRCAAWHADPATFEKTVVPVLTKACSPCHNENLASGGMNIAQFTQAASLTKSRDGWDIIVRKIRARRDASQRYAASRADGFRPPVPAGGVR